MIGLAALGVTLAAEPVRAWSLEQDASGLVPADTEGQWEWGLIPSEYGPAGGGTGASGWATRLNSPYYNEVEAALRLPEVPLGAVGWPMLTWLHWYDLDSGDRAWIAIDRGSGWERLDPIYGYTVTDGYTDRSGGWVRAWLDLTGIADLRDVAFVLTTDSTVQRPGWYIDELALWDGDIAPPRVGDLTVLQDTEDLDGPYVVQAGAVDNAVGVTVTLNYAFDGGPLQSVGMQHVGGDLYRGEIPGPGVPDTTIAYFVEATDGANAASVPADGDIAFRARLPAPLGLSGPAGRVVDVEAYLSWSAPVSDHALVGYRVWRGDTLLAEPTAPWAIVPLVGGDRDVFEVSGVFEAGEGDRTAPLALDVSLPEITGLSPAGAWQGDTVHLSIEGRYLLLSQADVELDLGDGITFTEVEVLDVDQALATVTVAPDALKGVRDLIVRSGEVEVVLPDAFEVMDGDGRPRLLSVTPDGLAQGEAATVRIEGNAPFAELPLVDLGEGVLIEDITLVAEAAVEVAVVVEPNAGLGERAVLVDDGERIHEGVGFFVRDAVVLPPSGRCGAGPRGGGWALLALGLLIRRRRSAPR
ncbi:MAG: hypothetical protein H6739_05200 [Alphaproteobacteria bacterium]|nr:hypothetical protein [Alphaproteobacteria bacterium]